MLNFGLTELRLVDPRCDHLSEASQAIAAGSYEILENAKICIYAKISAINKGCRPQIGIIHLFIDYITSDCQSASCGVLYNHNNLD